MCYIEHISKKILYTGDMHFCKESPQLSYYLSYKIKPDIIIADGTKLLSEDDRRLDELLLFKKKYIMCSSEKIGSVIDILGTKYYDFLFFVDDSLCPDYNLFSRNGNIGFNAYLNIYLQSDKDNDYSLCNKLKFINSHQPFILISDKKNISNEKTNIDNLITTHINEDDFQYFLKNNIISKPLILLGHISLKKIKKISNEYIIIKKGSYNYE